MTVYSNFFGGAFFGGGFFGPGTNPGGHFGFDEKDRNKRFTDELAAEKARREALQKALYGIPESQQEEVAEQVFGAPVVEDWTPFVDTRPAFEAAMGQLKALAESIRQAELAKRMREDDEDIEALIRFGAL